MKDYREIVSNSVYGRYDGMSDEDRNVYRWSFLMGMNLLLSKVKGEIFLIHPADYPDRDMVPPVLLHGGEVLESSLKVERVTLPGEESKPEWDRMCTYRIHFTCSQNGSEMTRVYEESDLSVEDVFSMFAFLYAALDDGEYEDIDEFYGYELS